MRGVFALFLLVLGAGPAWAVCSSPQTASIPAGGTATFECSLFGFEFPVPTAAHGTVSYGTPTNIAALVYANNSDGALLDTFQATDSDDGSTVTFNITIAPATSPLTVSPASLPTPNVSVAYNQTLTTSGGTAPYSYALSGGTLPPGLSLSTGGTISGTPTASGPHTFSILVTDSTPVTPLTATKSYTVNIPAPVLNITPDVPPNAAQGIPYNLTFTGSGGTAPYAFSIQSGSLPTGLSMNSSGVVSGTPTTLGAFTFSLKLDDSTTISTGGDHFIAQSVTITVVAPPTIVVNPATLPGATVGAAYSQTTSGSGGTAPYTFAVSAGALPNGLVLNTSSGAITGTPTASGTFNFTIRATDANSFSGTRAYTVVSAPPTIFVSPTTLPAAAVGSGYSQTVTASGGIAPYGFTVTAGALPAGLTLASNGTLSGTPTAGGTFNFTVTATDSSTGTGAPHTGSRAYALTVIQALAASITSTTNVSCNGGSNGSLTVTASGGTSPYIYSWAPSGGSAATASGLTAQSYTVTVTDNVLNSVSATGTVTQPSLLVVTPASLPGGTVGLAYSQTVASTGGTPPSGFSLSSGTLPTGLTLSAGGALSGTPTASGTFNFTVQATDANTCTANRGYTVVIAPPPTITLSPTTLPNGAVASAYNQTITASGGTAAYSFAITAGSLPGGMTLSSAGTLSGTPTAGGTFNLTVTATDANSFTGSRAYTLVIAAPTVSLAPAAGPLVDGTIGTAYSQTFTASGGSAPYSYALTAGALPAGLTLSATGVLSGTPTEFGAFSFSVTATDSSTGSGPYTTTNAYTLTIADLVPVANAVSATLAYGSSANPITLNITGGTPSSVAIASAPANGTAIASGTSITYTPSAGFAGADSFTYTATNASGTSAPATVSITVSAPTVVVAPATLPDGTSGVAYSEAITASGGAAPYSFAVTAGALPAGLSLASDGTLSGTPTAGGTFNFTVTATDSSSGAGPFTGSQAYSLTVNAATISVSPATLPTAAVGAAYNQSISASGGTAPYSFSLTAGSIPAGMSLSSVGVLSGTPTSGGTFNFTVTATDSSTGSGPFTGSRAYSLTVSAPTLVLSPSTLPDGTLSTAYSQALATSGGIAPYAYAVTAGTLPTGLSLSSSGLLSGTPVTVGSFSFSVTATDSSSGTGPYTVTNAYTINISDLVPIANAVSATVGYGSGANPITLNVTGGTPSSVAVASAPTNGIAIASGTSITYQPNPGFAGSDSFTYTATNASGTSAPATVSITVGAPTIVVDPPALGIFPVAGSAYSQTFTATGGAAPYSFSLASGTLPAGVSLSSAGVLSGTPTESGTFNFSIVATDSSTGTGPFTGAQAYSLTVNTDTLVSLSSAPDGAVGTPYSHTYTTSGGIAPYIYAVTSGVLPPGLTLSSSGVVSGTPTAGGTYSFVYQVTDSTGGTPATVSVPAAIAITAPTITLAPTTLPGGVASNAYNQVLSASGGSGPYTFSLVGGALPIGTSFTSAGVLSGTPTAAGTFDFTVRATDANGFTGDQAYALTITAPTITLTPTTLPGGTAGTAYSQALAGAGGAGPYSFSILSGALPVGVSFSSAGVLSGTPITAGTFNFTVRATDANSFSGDQAYTVTITAPTITLTPTTLPDGTAGAAYSQTLTGAGGVGPYSFSLLSGALPVGMSFSSAGVLSGTPITAGTFNFTVRATDANGFTGDQAYALTITAPTITLTPTALPDGTAGTAYSQTLTGAGGVGPYSFSLLSGALPVGMSFSSAGVLSGTPTTAGVFNFTVQATDANGFTGSQAYTLTVSAPTISITPASLPAGGVGTAYSQALSASGGSAPYTFTVTAGALPAGLGLSTAGVLSGTPTANGSFNFTVTATDSGGFTGSASHTLVIAAATVTISPTTLPGGIGGVAYDQFVSASGGIAPYSFWISNGTLPTGVGFDGGGHLQGTPTTAGSFTFEVSASDSSGGTPSTATQTYTVVITAPSITLAPATLPDGAGGVAYSQSIAATGGTSPYTFAIQSGALPTGLTLSASGVSGTPTAAGSFTFTIQATDANGFTGSQAYTVAVTAPTITLAPTTLPGGAVGSAYNQSITAVGGTSPYTFALQVGALPSGMSLSTTGVLSGTPTSAGSFNFTVQATDANGFTGSQAYTLAIAAPTITLAPATLPGGATGSAYSQTIIASGGTAPYSYTVTNGALPTGVSLDAAGNLTGTPTAAGSFTFEITALDSFGYDGLRSYTVAIIDAAPVAANDAATTNAGSAVTVPITANDTGVISSVAVASAPANGTAVVSGLNIVYTPNAAFFGTDSFTYTAIGPGGTSNVATVTITVLALPVPTGVPQSVSTLAGQAVSFDAATGATGSPFTGITVVSAPADGTLQVSGTVVTYTSLATASGTVSVTYTLNNAFGASAPITSTIIITPRPVAVAHTATTMQGVPAFVDLNPGASGGPFTAAAVVSVSPATAGTTQVTESGSHADRQFRLKFTPTAGFTGVVHVSYTLANVFATSTPADVTITVTERPDPSHDPEVAGLLAAQTTAARRFANSQIGNFQQRMEGLHGGENGEGFSNGLTVTIARRCMDGRLKRPDLPCEHEAMNGLTNAQDADLASGNGEKGKHGGPAIWASGNMTFGDYDAQRGTGGDGFEFETSGISAGADYHVTSTFAIGAGIGYGRDVTDVGDNGTRSKASARSVAIYGSVHPGGAFYLDGLLGYQWMSFDSRRYVSATGGHVDGDRDGTQWFASLSAIYERRTDAMLIAPYLRVDLARAKIDAFTESGDPVYALHYGEQDVDTTTGNLGVRFEFRRRTSWGMFSPLLRLEYQHDFEDPGSVTLSYADMLGGPVYRAEILGRDRSRFMFGIGGILQTERDWMLRAEYRGLFGGDDRDEQSILINVEKKF
ncbi:hypothetical protein GCM10027432_18220 [Lysobacter fragariae]